MVGAPFERSGATGVDGNQADDSDPPAGAAYVFVRVGMSWSQQAYLTASSTDPDDLLGEDVSISGDRIAVGAPNEASDAALIDGGRSIDTAGSAGAVYLFRRLGTAWSPEACVKASNSELGDRFGTSLSLAGTRLPVGAPFEDSNSKGVGGDQSNDLADNAGADYVFSQSVFLGVEAFVQQQDYLKASNAQADDQFGRAVRALLGTVIVGALFESSDAGGFDGDQTNHLAHASGAVYVYRLGDADWLFEDYMKSTNSRENDLFGAALSCHDGALVVGASKEPSDGVGIDGNHPGTGAPESGAVYSVP